MATITVTDLATTLGTDPRTARKFLRTITPAENHPGKGARWEIEKRDIRSLTSKFKKYSEGEQQKRLDRELEKQAEKAKNDSPIETEGPTDAELEMIDAELDI